MFTMNLFTSERKFEVWRWGVGHSGLLLRSNPKTNPSRDISRIEVRFNPAHAVSLPSFFTGLAIDDDGPMSARESAETLLGRSLRPWENVYSISVGIAEELVGEVAMELPVGWVVGGSVSGRQDHQRWDSPTMFDGYSPGPGVETLFDYKFPDT